MEETIYTPEWERMSVMLSQGSGLSRVHQIAEVLKRASSDNPRHPRVVRQLGALAVTRPMTYSTTPLDKAGIQLEIARFADVRVFDARASQWVEKDIPLQLAEQIRSSVATDDELWISIPTVSRFTDVPIIDSDGNLIVEDGLADSGVWYQPSLALPTGLDAAPDDIYELNDAKAVIDRLFRKFSFVDNASKTNAIGLMLLPFVREYIGNHPTPMHLTRAPQAGCGKSTLMRTCLIPAFGDSIVEHPPMRNDDELRKEVTSLLQTATSHVVIDNVDGAYESPTLASMIQTTTWGDRLLGSSVSLKLPNRMLVCMTGTNTELTPELQDRTCLIELTTVGGVAPRDLPADYFDTPDIEEWAREHRTELIEACMTLIAHWLAGPVDGVAPDGSFHRVSDYEDLTAPSRAQQTRGTFNHWSEIIGGILMSADYKDFDTNRDRISGAAGKSEIADFFVAMHEIMPPEFTSQHLADAIQMRTFPADTIPSDFGAMVSARQVGCALRVVRGASHGGFTLQARVGGGRVTFWRVEPVE